MISLFVVNYCGMNTLLPLHIKLYIVFLTGLYHFFCFRYLALKQWQIMLKKKKLISPTCQVVVIEGTSFAGGTVCVEISQLTGPTFLKRKCVCLCGSCG